MAGQARISVRSDDPIMSGAVRNVLCDMCSVNDISLT